MWQLQRLFCGLALAIRQFNILPVPLRRHHWISVKLWQRLCNGERFEIMATMRSSMAHYVRHLIRQFPSQTWAAEPMTCCLCLSERNRARISFKVNAPFCATSKVTMSCYGSMYPAHRTKANATSCLLNDFAKKSRAARVVAEDLMAR